VDSTDSVVITDLAAKDESGITAQLLTIPSKQWLVVLR
jgi:hypothetical protein